MASVYTADGVDVSEGDLFSAFAGEICRASYKNSPYVKIHDFSRGHFRGFRSFSFEGLPSGHTIDIAPDGIGTKVIVVDAAVSHRQSCRDLIAMTAGDITRFGGIPLVFANVLDVSTLGKSKGNAAEQLTNTRLRELIEGMGEACKEQKLVAYKGETAELGPCVSSEIPNAVTKFNWAGMMVGVCHPKMMITGEGLRAGQSVMALRENGFRSNGISTVRKALSYKFGSQWWSNPEAHAAISDAATPSTLYDRFLCEANGWYDPPNFQPLIKVHLVVHVTGGAIKSKLAEDILFPRNLGAVLDNLWTPPNIMRDSFEWRKMGDGPEFTDEEAYGAWHGGQGVLAVIDSVDERGFRILASQHGIEVKNCGYISAVPKVMIRSQFTAGVEIVYSKK